MITLSSQEVASSMSRESPNKGQLLPLWRRMEFTVWCDEIHFAGNSREPHAGVLGSLRLSAIRAHRLPECSKSTR